MVHACLTRRQALSVRLLGRLLLLSLDCPTYSAALDVNLYDIVLITRHLDLRHPVGQ